MRPLLCLAANCTGRLREALVLRLAQHIRLHLILQLVAAIALSRTRAPGPRPLLVCCFGFIDAGDFLDLAFTELPGPGIERRLQLLRLSAHGFNQALHGHGLLDAIAAHQGDDSLLNIPGPDLQTDGHSFHLPFVELGARPLVAGVQLHPHAGRGQKAFCRFSG